MRLFIRMIACLFVMIAIAGCASPSNVTARDEYKGGKKIARPEHIYIYDFTAFGDTSAKLTPEQAANKATAEKVGAEISAILVKNIRSMGLQSVRATSQTSPSVGDIVIKGQVLSVDKGDASQRVAVGFGSGASSLKASVEGYLQTMLGLKRIGSADLKSEGDKSPGMALGVATTIANSNPAGLIINAGRKMYGESNGSSTIEGRAEEIAKEISTEMQVKFKDQGWI
ncbi:DUF4410 domain-containing protein [Candidatus Methylospira mobilis]|uniref:DUF4410 domain-containing protein n=3 Tax=Candidatus Methylospira mobilis TaxID=1808979 RepID=A0A5Q0BLP9_9GAMM|nr:DUF4410 domain-containing protein [Candidatus Methylospira mobilis]